ncbi:hypothetical protein QBC39DRAFT_20847 [Podospora conica]|nr:hypothetical protein QBC39DRAFT_20847 [Schizothecium conicum]
MSKWKDQAAGLPTLPPCRLQPSPIPPAAPSQHCRRGDQQNTAKAGPRTPRPYRSGAGRERGWRKRDIVRFQDVRPRWETGRSTGGWELGNQKQDVGVMEATRDDGRGLAAMDKTKVSKPQQRPTSSHEKDMHSIYSNMETERMRRSRAVSRRLVPSPAITVSTALLAAGSNSPDDLLLRTSGVSLPPQMRSPRPAPRLPIEHLTRTLLMSMTGGYPLLAMGNSMVSNSSYKGDNDFSSQRLVALINVPSYPTRRRPKKTLNAQ